ncbi:hypothetical protein B1R32_12226 [Abditibacterium utsteinense]|uniref:Translocation and assembly module TamB C-terminal domain-containing protein n=1 Tax=Abditibacterium utsteinense TaxID=1960156 RepID=A0A2S8SPT5_9BACT|nr:translocation/assembly module TamB domain-containing protein [Abditibacterium utsteinense]PQV62779.1 hypothetical protein B1R32_12226 [Abditibacterium utsteinense]
MPDLPDFHSARARLRRLKSGLPQQKIARRNGGRAPKSPFLVRGGSSITGGSLPAGRFTRGFSLIFFLALLLLCARWYLGQKLDLSGQVERVLRAQIVPQLEKQLDQKVEFGAVETDWLGRVIVREMVIGRNANLPTGALARAKSVTIHLDLPGLVLRRATFPDAIQSVSLEAPQIYLSRDKNGFNWTKILQSGQGGAATKWQGHISATNGRVYVLDTTIRDASGQPLILDARRIDASSDTFLEAPYRFTASSQTPYLGANALLLPAISARGALQSDAKNGLFTVETQGAPFAPLADFAFPKREITARGGNIGGRVVFTLENGQLAQHGALSLQNLSFFAAQLREPNSGRAVPIDALSGPFEFAGNASGNAFSTPGATFSALGSRFQTSGAISLSGDSPFDFDLQTTALPLAAMRRFLPAAPGLNFSSSAAPLSVHLSGNAAGKARQIASNGVLNAPRARFSDARSGTRGAFPNLKTFFAASATLTPTNQLSDWKFAARGAASGGEIAAPQGEIAVESTLFSARAARFGGLELNYSARDFSLKAPRYGQSRGQLLQVSASAPDAMRPNFSGALRLQGAQTQGIRLAAISPALSRAVKSSGALDVQADFSGLNAAFDLQKVRGAATFSLVSLQLDPAAFPTKNEAGAAPWLQNSDFSLSSLRGRLAFTNGNLQLSRAGAVSSFGALQLDASVPLDNPSAARIALSLPAATVSAARFAPFLHAQNVALEGDWRGRVSLLSRAATGKNGAPRFGLDFDLQSPASTLRGLASGARNGASQRPGAVFLSAPRLRGRAEFAAGESLRWNGVATLDASESRIQSGRLGRIAALPAELSGARAAGVRFSFAARSDAPQNLREMTQRQIAPSQAARSTKNEGAPREISTGTAPLEIIGHLEARSLSAPVPPGFGTGASVGAARRGAILTLREARADLKMGRGGLSVPRFSARYGAGNLAGTARLEGSATHLKMLAQNIDLSSAQRLFAPDSLRTARAAGRGSALVEMAPGQNPRAAIRLPRGAVTLNAAALNLEGKPLPFPVDGARADITLLDSGALKVQNAILWSEGARLLGNATLEPSRWSGNVEVSGARLARFAALPLARGLADAARPDGLLGGTFSFGFDPRNWNNARLQGSVDLKLAQLFGAQINAARAAVSLQNSARGMQISIADLKGEVEDTPFSGSLSADFSHNTWNATFAASKLESGRLTRLRALQNAVGSETREAILAQALPLAGDVGTQIELSGTLKNARGTLSPRAKNGFARLFSGPLRWRGRPLGALRADVEIEGGVARAKTLEVSRPTKNGEEASPLIQITGDLPLDAKSPDLNAQIRVASAPLSFFVEALQQSRDAMRASKASIPFFERAVSYVDALPDGTTGQVALDATLSGAWSAPRLHVSSLTLRDARTRVPAGGFSPPAMLDAAFTFEKGAVAIEKAEFRIKKSLVSSPVSESPNSDEDDDTLLRVEPGGSAVPDGPISLAADIFNANLSQLSPWIPALRTSDGAPLLRGELSEFSFRVGGTTIDPEITGSVQGENLALDNYTLDRLRVSRFEIAKGAARIEPGNLTLVKGAFQSSAAYGQVPWSWSRPGPVMDGPLDVHFPLQTRDFGALVGTFVPALTVADADEFTGSIDVAGTLQAPALSGAITIRGGQFRLDAQKSPLAAGLREVSGTVRFVGGTRLLIDADDPLKGKIVSAGAIVGRPARRIDIAEREPGREIVAAGGPDPKSNLKRLVAAPNSTKNQTPSEPKLAGNFVLRGSVERPAQIDALLDMPLNPALSREERRNNAARLRALLDPAAALSRLKYDLSLGLDGGAYSSPSFGGVNDLSAGVIWKSGARDVQNVRWMIAARGQKNTRGARKTKGGGTLSSFGSLALRRDFGSGIESIARSGARDFSGEADFADFAVAKRIEVSKFPDRRAQVSFDNFASSLTGAGSGVLDGRLVLDNGARQQQAPRDAVRLQNASLAVRSRRTLFGPQFESDFTALPFTVLPRVAEIQSDGATDIQAESEGDISGENNAPLRLGGVLTLVSAEIYGAPAGGEGAALLLSRLPSAPRFDIRLKMGRDVQIVTSSFRAGLEGELVASGSPADPQVLGVLSTRDGQVRFPNARARVEEGRVTISLTRDPETDGLRTRVEIDATARGQAGRYAITLHLRGPLDLSGAKSAQSLQIEVSSNPPLSQSEAFEQLLGTVPNVDEDGNLGSTNRAYASAVLNVLSAPLFSGVEQTLAQTLGLSSVGFEYRFNEPLAVQLTKTLGDRVIVSYRRSLGSGPASSIAAASNGRTPFELRIDYRLRGNYLLGLQTDERQIPSITLQKTQRF